MIQFIIGILLVVVALMLFVAYLKSSKQYNKELNRYIENGQPLGGRPDIPFLGPVTKIVSAVMGIVGVIILLFSCIYFQDPGESIVLRSFTGSLSGVSSDSGAHVKSPFDTCVGYDVRNNTITFVGDGTEDEVHGGTARGPQITFQDKEGVTGNLDIVVRYSIDPNAVSDLYTNYLNQENFVTKVVAQDIRSISRQIPGRYGTLELFNSRADAEQAIFDALKTKWANLPILLEGVSLQEIRYSEEIKTRYDEAQAARVAVDRAQAEQDAALITAETARITAQGQSDANAILEQSLTEPILRQRYIDALNNGASIYVVPEGSTPLIGVQP